MSKKQLLAIVITASITAVIVSFGLKAVGLPEGDAHPMITSAVATVAAIIVGQKVKASEDQAHSRSE